jgi:glucokinase
MVTRSQFGVDVGGTKILGVALADGVTIASVRRPTPDSTDDLIESIAAVAEELAATSGSALDELGVGIPGFIDPEGLIRQAPNLPSAVGTHLGSALSSRLGIPVSVENDANCMAWASYCLDAPEARLLAAATFGTGIGGGLVIDGRVVRGAHGFAGEPGHMVIVSGGERCNCGNLGCWEAYGSGSALRRQSRAAVERGSSPSLLEAASGDLDAVDGPLVERLAREGDAAAVAVFDHYAAWIAEGLVGIINLVDPDVITLGGGVIGSDEWLVEQVRDHLSRVATVVHGRSVDVRRSRLGPEAGAAGAALIVDHARPIP